MSDRTLTDVLVDRLRRGAPAADTSAIRNEAVRYYEVERSIPLGEWLVAHGYVSKPEMLQGLAEQNAERRQFCEAIRYLRQVTEELAHHRDRTLTELNDAVMALGGEHENP